ncbi:MAG: alkaline phosphatase family protein [Acidimicrobiia bacterium]
MTSTKSPSTDSNAGDEPSPVLPDYAGGCISNIIPALLEWDTAPAWIPEPAREANQVVLLIVDGLGWEQLQQRRAMVPTLAAMVGGAITSVSPTTTATALTSITTGTAPGEHGVVGYRMALEGEVLNVLRWATQEGDARRRFIPQDVQPLEPFGGQRAPVVTKALFERTGFTGAHLAKTRFHGYRMTSTLVVEVDRLMRQGEPFVYAYYDGLDSVAHEYGFGEHYDAELRAVEALVNDVLAVLPRGATLLISADHGQIQTGDNLVEPHPEVLTETAMQSGEARMRWFHARAGRSGALLDALRTHHGHQGWIRTRQEAIAEGWFGPVVSGAAEGRLGDVVVAPWGTEAFVDPADSGPFELVGRHGSLTSAEMLVPLIAAGR